MNIRPFQDYDTNGIIELILPIQQQEFEIPIDLDMQPDLSNIRNFYQGGNGNFWVAVSDARLVGTIGLIDIGNKKMALRKMFVQLSYRGSKFGTAQLLLQQALDWCSLKKINNIYLGTREEFHAAQRFYAKNGFREIDRELLPTTFPAMSTDNKFYQYKFNIETSNEKD